MKLKNTKKNKLLDEINHLTSYHYSKCKEYKNILDHRGYKLNTKYKLQDLPFIPARIFKYLELKSIKNKNVIKILTSSGTSGENPSKIFLDKNNALNQRVALNKIFKNYVSNERLPMIVVGKRPKISRDKFDAKTAAILGFSNFSNSISYTTNEDNKIDYNLIESFLKNSDKKKYLIFGFTSEVYSFFNLILKSKYKFNFKNGVLLHGGGWKKLESLKISNSKFNNFFKKKLGINNIINYYGLIEQVGSIFFECQKCNNFVCSDYSDILIRDKKLNIKKTGRGFIQLISSLPTSYPGHNILTEDIGEIIKPRNKLCRHIGKTFKVYGRSKKSEIRGCSNV